jgi:hypothetical protein
MTLKRLTLGMTALALPMLTSTAFAHASHGAPALHVHPPSVDQCVAACVLAVAGVALLTHAARAAVRVVSR